MSPAVRSAAPEIPLPTGRDLGPIVAAAVLLVIFLLEVLGAMAGTSPVFDEDKHIAAGYAYWKFGSGRVNYQQPPLVKIIAGVPLLMLNPQITRPPTSDRQNDYDPWIADFLTQNKARLNLMLFLARLPVAILAAALGIGIFAWSRELFGLNAAFVALVLYTFEPNFLGNSGLVFMDVPLAVLSFFSTYAFWKWCQNSRGIMILASGALLGLALLTKFPALALIPLYALLATLHYRRGPRARHIAVRRALGLLSVYLVALFVLLLVYGAFFGGEYLIKEGAPNYAYEHLFSLSRRLPTGIAERVGGALRFLGEEVPVVGLDYWRGVYWQRQHLNLGLPSFLLGQYSDHGWWYFHLAAFGLKTTLPMLVLIGLRILLSRRLPWQPAEVFLAAPALATVALSAVSPLGGGLRYILPAYPFVIVLISRLGALVFNRQRIWIGVLTVLLAWHAFSALRTYPYYLAFFNEVAGGPAGGYRYLVGSNLDFGQDVKRLGAYLQSQKVQTAYLSVHNTVDPSLYGIRYLPLAADGRCRTGVIAVSATHLQGVPFENKQAFVWLKNKTPIAVLGHSIFVYDVTACP